MPGTRVRTKNAFPPPSWFSPSCVLRVYCERKATFQVCPISWSTFNRNVFRWKPCRKRIAPCCVKLEPLA